MKPEKRRIREIIVVEGVYDKNTLKQVVDATVIDIGGFGIFRDAETKALLRRMAEERGLIILTDSDGAGFVIRNHLKGILPGDKVKHAYIPDVYGKESRKTVAGREGKLGVEGMPPEVLLSALDRAGATDDRRDRSDAPDMSDYYSWGLSGAKNSEKKRKSLKKNLGLPEHMSAKALFSVLSALYTKSELEGLIKTENFVK